jgi:hypothetical protein
MAGMRNQVHKQRPAVLKHVWTLARSGQRADVSRMGTARHEVDGFEAAPHRIADWSCRARLNNLCALTYGEGVASGSPFARERRQA